MQNNSLINLLKSFTNKEIQDFNDFLISPYFNKKNSVIGLYEILKKYYPDFADESIAKKRIYEKLFPGKVYNDSNLRVLVHKLNELAKRFISYRNFESNQIEFGYRQLVGLINKRQFSNIEKMINRLTSNLNAERILAEDYNFYKFRLEYENLFFLSESHFGIFEKFLNKADLEKIFRYFSSFYYIKSMRLYINVLNLQLIYSKSFKTEQFEKMVSLIDKSIFKDNPIIEIYYCIIKLFDRKNNEKFYFRIKEILKEIKKTLHNDDLDEIYINLTNYCNRKISAGIKTYEKEKFELYKEEIELKIYNAKGYMAPVYYKNLVILALSLNEYNWIKEFIHNYKNELPEDTRTNTYNYCMALYEFDMKIFDKSLEHLSKIKFDELYLKYDSKILQIMIYYEMKSEEPLFSSMEAFRHFLSNNKLLPDIKKNSYLNFYKFFKKVVNFNIKKDILEMEALREKISADITVSQKFWIMSKMDKLCSSKNND